MVKLNLVLPKTLLALVAVSLSLLIWWIAGRELVSTEQEFSPVIQTHLECQTGSNSKATLTTFINTPGLAQVLSQTLCTNSIVAKQFGQVKIYWNQYEDQVLQFVGKGIADLALVKENLMQALRAENSYGYRMIASYPDYSAYLIANREKPRLTKEYLLGKRIGLLDYPTSRSGHIIPMGLFKSLGLSSEQLQFVYANSHTELRQLLISGKVDMISSYWQESDSEILSKNYITPLEQQVSGNKWYLKMQTNNVNLFCAIQESLIEIARKQNSSYYNQLAPEPSCDIANESQS
ncbi:PhnD/SsuA/transferrin family substrate-binding protein [Aliiglaciecola sp. CAU 1673]|uniref:PhnD/SsuA/transferrin family substrate-binding protein n=1 Tax=Aliiglaciecola sp. CAU 1673 TaxID=3032595 RepID=UPI0023DBF020|nr:PhnD/SsuA/transferrin family substrate-binding protein [Aliiglaciecola sp. CAU 1673]MDF2176763.1 PhnD/SsuA/transferrin family substrate-binding protein [Aliiglaciecola sp. CAU 1673]